MKNKYHTKYGITETKILRQDRKPHYTIFVLSQTVFFGAGRNKKSFRTLNTKIHFRRSYYGKVKITDCVCLSWRTYRQASKQKRNCLWNIDLKGMVKFCLKIAKFFGI